jgi:ribosomal protein S18 acetylase RimI-like enzyme
MPSACLADAVRSTGMGRGAIGIVQLHVGPARRGRGRVSPDGRVSVRLLGPGEGAVLVAVHGVKERFFDDEPPERPRAIGVDVAERLLGDPAVRYWVAEVEGRLVGFLHCVVVRLLRSPHERELLMYDIAVDPDRRRRGVASALVAAMEDLMRAEQIPEVWLGADLDAVAFYEATGFTGSDERFMAKVVPPHR